MVFMFMLAKIKTSYHNHVMYRIAPLTEIGNFTAPAEDLSSLLKRADNTDVAQEFPATVARYGGSASEAEANLEAAAHLYEVGSREQFIVFSGEKAVGMCLITNQIDIPDGINPNVPNISGFVANPFRNQGIGRVSITERMKVVEKNFNNRAWTFVRDDNLISEHLVLSVGFQKTNKEVKGWEGHHLYLFGDTES
jgi:RimJ/RimL family protein N-acetyltransferase